MPGRLGARYRRALCISNPDGLRFRSGIRQRTPRCNGELAYAGLHRAVRRKEPVPEVEVIAVLSDEATVDALLAGWEGHGRTASGLDWLRTRATTVSSS